MATLHYAGEQFSITADMAKGLVASRLHEASTQTYKIGEHHWIHIATGPGIPIIITEDRKVDADS
jgi:hypothetical protein